jgi:hypothetical protein
MVRLPEPRRDGEMNAKIRKWITGSKIETSNYLYWEAGTPGCIGDKRETSDTTGERSEPIPAPLHDAATPRPQQGRKRIDVKVKENAKKLKEELSLQFQYQLTQRRERPLVATDNELPRLPLWVSIFLGVSVPFLIAMVARELMKVRNWNWEDWVSNEPPHGHYYDP